MDVYGCHWLILLLVELRIYISPLCAKILEQLRCVVDVSVRE